MNQEQNPKPSSEHHGILLVDKPAGITSHDVVDRVRKIFSTRRVGHTGTLDPQATGLLVILLGEATKISEYLVGVDKTYEGTMRLGVVSDTYDSDGEVVPGPGGAVPTSLDDLQEAAGDFTGSIQQAPPPYSAKKIGGRRLYEIARKGEQLPEIPTREVRVDDFEILTLVDGVAEFGVDCSSGTYVRSLVHDLGQKLGCGAILTELRRTDVGQFGIEDALTLEQLEHLAAADPAGLRKRLIPIARGLSALQRFYLAPGAELWVRRGQCIPHSLVHDESNRRPQRNSLVLLCRLTGVAVAIARVDPAPISPPPKAMTNPVPPWYQPLKQFEADAGDHDAAESSDQPAP